MDRNLLANATSADDSPTPGYMFNEISRSTLANYTACTQIQEYLLSRITKNNHNIKFKCLMIIKHICRTGRAEFKKEIGRNVDPIKECLQYKGPPDPLRGDEIYRRVREAAREALDAIYDSQMPVTTSAVASANRIQGMGNDYVPDDVPKTSSNTGYLSSIVSTVSSAVLGDNNEPAYAGHPGAAGSFQPPSAYGSGSSVNGSNMAQSGYSNTSYSSSGMAGIGNPNFGDAREEKSWYQRAAQSASSSISSVASAIGVGEGGSTSGKYANNAFGGAGTGHSDYNYATNRGPNAFGGSSHYSPQQPGNAFGSNARLPTAYPGGNLGLVPEIPKAPGAVGRAGAAASDGAYEQSMIESLCEPGGLKPVPAEDKLAAFLNAAVTLSADIVGNCLVDVLNSESWQSRVKGLIVIGHLVKLREAESHAQWWVEHAEDVSALASDSKAAVRTQAAKTAQLIGRAGGGGSVGTTTDSLASLSPQHSTAVSSKANTVGETSLLDSYDDISSAAPAAAPSTGFGGFGAPADDAGDMFAGMSLGGGASAHQVPPAVPAAAPAFAPPPVPSAVTPSSSSAIGNHFDFLDSEVPAAVPPPVPASAAASAAAPSWGAPPAAAPVMAPVAAAVPAGDLFGDMNVMGAPVAASAPKSYANELMDMNFGAAPAVGNINYNHNVMGGGMQQRPPQMMGNPYPPQQQQQQQPPQQQQQQFGGGGFPQGGNVLIPQQMNHGHIQQQQQFGHPGSQHQPGYNPSSTGYRPGGPANVIAPGMLSATAPRKNIPTADEIGGSSGFSFMGGAPPMGSPGKMSRGGKQAAPVHDSFSFVTEQMNAMNSKK